MAVYITITDDNGSFDEYFVEGERSINNIKSVIAANTFTDEVEDAIDGLDEIIDLLKGDPWDRTNA